MAYRRSQYHSTHRRRNEMLPQPCVYCKSDDGPQGRHHVKNCEKAKSSRIRKAEYRRQSKEIRNTGNVEDGWICPRAKKNTMKGTTKKFVKNQNIFDVLVPKPDIFEGIKGIPKPAVFKKPKGAWSKGKPKNKPKKVKNEDKKNLEEEVKKSLFAEAKDKFKTDCWESDSD